MDDVGLPFDSAQGGELVEPLLKAYWEQLHDRLVESRGLLSAKIDALLKSEIDKRGFPDFDEHRYAAYREASLAFLEERIEAYNPVGLQYLFDPDRRREAAELEFGLDWFNGRDEFERLLDAAGRKAGSGLTDEQLCQSAGELIREMGAYPDHSIIAGYEAAPAPQKLADYIVARAIEEVIY
jgi:hypothetical protein